jgi:hypothetical protein
MQERGAATSTGMLTCCLMQHSCLLHGSRGMP